MMKINNNKVDVTIISNDKMVINIPLIKEDTPEELEKLVFYIVDKINDMGYSADSVLVNGNPHAISV